MSQYQEIEDYISTALANDDIFGIRLRVQKLQAQMSKYGFDLIDVCYVLRHPERMGRLSGKGERYMVLGEDIDGVELTVIVTKGLEGKLKVVNAWRNDQ